MKNTYLVLLIFFFIVSCNTDDQEDNTIDPNVDFRQEMRSFVIEISQYAKSTDTNFAIVPQNGIELATENGEPDGPVSTGYLNAIDGNGQEDLFYGYDNDDEATPKNESDYLTDLLKVSANQGNAILVTDYCSTPAKMDDAYQKNETENFISFAASERELNVIPSYPTPIREENDNEISSLTGAQNFLYLINPESFTSKAHFIESVTSSNYDLLIMDLFFHDGELFTSQEIETLRAKANGGKRMIICYMSIGEAEDYRYYWQSAWNSTKPEWMDKENPDWKGNFKVRYWMSSWKEIIYGNDHAYLDKILAAGFDGVYLDIIDAYEYFE